MRRIAFRCQANLIFGFTFTGVIFETEKIKEGAEVAQTRAGAISETGAVTKTRAITQTGLLTVSRFHR